MSLWTGHGLLTEGLGPQAEWSPVPPDQAQIRHGAFWATVSGMMPDDEHDEPYWMTQDATQALIDN
jgi:hypothetical protein